MIEWLKSLLGGSAPTDAAPPAAQFVGLPMSVNLERHSRTALVRHASRLATLYSAEPSPSIQKEIERRCKELKLLIGVAPLDEAQARSLLEMLRA